MERLWLRFKQIGANENGILKREDLENSSVSNEAFAKNASIYTMQDYSHNTNELQDDNCIRFQSVEGIQQVYLIHLSFQLLSTLQKADDTIAFHTFLNSMKWAENAHYEEKIRGTNFFIF